MYPEVEPEGPMKLSINGENRDVNSDAKTPLLWVIRDELKLTGTKFGCGKAQCGACTVWLDGKPVRACVTPVTAAREAKVTTIEGLDGDIATAVTEAWLAVDVAQCGYCQPGQIMSASALLERNPTPNDEEIDAAMNGNLCRCATYNRIRTAIKQASAKLAAEKST